MVGVLIIMGLVAVSAITGFVIIYKKYFQPKEHWDELYEMLRKKGIGDRPENIVKSYYRMQGKFLLESEVRKLTRQYLIHNKDFFITMYDAIIQNEREEKE